MAGKNNLIKAEDLTKEELTERARKGGVASGKARREKKAFKETIETLLSMSTQEGNAVSIEEIQSFASLSGQNISVQEAIAIAQVQKAMQGDTKAAEYVRDSIGQKPSDKLHVNTGMELNDKLKEVEAYIKGLTNDSDK